LALETDRLVDQRTTDASHQDRQGMTRVKFSVNRDMEFGQNIVLVRIRSV
jgi:hypothetical protein